MEALSIFLCIASIVLFILGIVFIALSVKKKKPWKQYLFCFLAAIISFVLYLAIVPYDWDAPRPEKSTEEETEEFQAVINTTKEPNTTNKPTEAPTTAVTTTQPTTVPTTEAATKATTETTTKKSLSIKEKVQAAAIDNFSTQEIVVEYDEDNKIATITSTSETILSAKLETGFILSSMRLMLEDLKDDTSFGIQFYIKFPMVDAYGNTYYDEVIDAYYSAETRQKINWDGFLSKNLPIIADSFYAIDELYQYIF